ncbi:MAG: hypothetical protein ABIR92_07425 [Gemmatimonadaceae bacterium]
MLSGRAGHTILEMLVATTIGTLVIALGASIAFKQQRFHRDVVIAVERTDQLEQIVALMPISIRSIAPGEGDIAPGAARDTSFEFRATIATSLVCDSAPGRVVLAPAAPSPRLTSMITRPEPGDTAWLLTLSDSTEKWIPRVITGVSEGPHACALGGAPLFGTATRSSVALGLASPLPPPGTPIRVTRPWRYSLYRASDGAWYLGAKDWSSELGRFNTIQPVAGPFLSAATSGLRFGFADSLGAPIPTGTMEPRRISLVEVAFRTDSVIPGKYPHATSIRGRSTAVVALRNRDR